MTTPRLLTDIEGKVEARFVGDVVKTGMKTDEQEERDKKFFT